LAKIVYTASQKNDTDVADYNSFDAHQTDFDNFGRDVAERKYRMVTWKINNKFDNLLLRQYACQKLIKLVDVRQRYSIPSHCRFLRHSV